MLVNLSEAKTHLSKLVNLAYQGEKITITKHNLPMVDLVVHQPTQKPTGKRKFGMFKGKLSGLDNVDWFVKDKALIDWLKIVRFFQTSEYLN